jgi:hypothetical protein
MENNFYRIELNGEKTWFDFDEIHILRKDILIFMDDNIGEFGDYVMPLNQYHLEYWKYISINYEEEWAESKRYKRLIEEGCLNLLNGISCELLYEPVSDIKKEWYGTDVNVIIKYIEAYTPSTDKLLTAKNYLLENYMYIKNFSWQDVDDEQCLINSNKYTIGKWFDSNIVKSYYSEIIVPMLR